jgi:hypothetical protein
MKNRNALIASLFYLTAGQVSTDGRENQCGQCSKKFRSRSALLKHLVVHKQIKYRFTNKFKVLVGRK